MASYMIIGCPTSVENRPVGPLALQKGYMANWIKGAIKRPGALHKQLGIPQGRKIPSKTLQTAAKASGTLGRRARLAQTLGKLR
jgi:hypothetical protein